MTSTEPTRQQPCVHCGDCARACPEGLDPEALFFALVGDDRQAAQRQRLDACSECNRCTGACPSHIPLLDWFRWGKSEAHWHAQAGTARMRFLDRNARLARERAERAARQATATGTAAAAPPAAAPAQTISKSEVLAAIARGRARKAQRDVKDRGHGQP